MRRAKSEAFEMARAVAPKHLAGLFVRQPEQLGVGHAVFCARRAVGNDAFAVLLSDDLMLQEAGAPAGDLVTACASSRESAISLAETPLSDVGKCDVAAPGRELSATMLEVAPLQETPSSEAPPSLFANCGRYPCTPQPLDIPERTRRGAGGEFRFADAINQPARRSRFVAQQFVGRRYGGCDKLGYGKAVVDARIQSAHSSREIEKVLRSLDFERVASPVARPRTVAHRGAASPPESRLRRFEPLSEAPVVLDRVKCALPSARRSIRGTGPLTAADCCNVRAWGNGWVRDAARIGNRVKWRAV